MTIKFWLDKFKPKTHAPHSDKKNNNPLNLQKEIQGISTQLVNGQFEIAEIATRNALSHHPYNPQLWELLGSSLEQKNPEEAATCYLRAIELEPNLPKSYLGLGVVNLFLNKPSIALVYLEKSSQLSPDDLHIWIMLADTLVLLDRNNDALVAYQRAISLTPTNSELFYKQGKCLADLTRFNEAEVSFKTAIELRPDFENAYYQLGAIYQELKNYISAKEIFNQLIILNPKNPNGYSGLTDVFILESQFEKAYQTQISGIKIHQTETVEIHRQMMHICANIYGKEKEVEYHLNRIEQIAPDASHFNDAVHFIREQKFSEAFAILDQFDHESVVGDTAEFNKALALLVLGFYREGWIAYESRKNAKLIQESILHTSKYIPLPFWDGTPILDKTLVVVLEQGIGDCIHFIRYLPLLKQYASKVIFTCNPIIERLFRCIPDIELADSVEDVINADYQILLISLPMIFKTELATIPNVVPYLSAETELVEVWQSRLMPWKNTFKVGLVWAGGAIFKGDLNRSVKLSQFAPIFELQRVTFFSLQLGPQSAQIQEKPVGAELIDFTEYITDFSDTAAFVTELDLVISVDTSVAHLAGALGKPLWVLLPFYPDHRWFLEREDNPWYPTARLFRQDRTRRWDDVFLKVKDALSSAVSVQNARPIVLIPPKRDLATESELQMQKGRVAYQQGEYEQARSIFERAVVLNPALPNAWYNLGLANQALDRPLVAKASYLRVLALDPSDSGVYFNLGCIAANHRDYTEAWDYFSKSWNLNPADPETAYNYSHLLWNVLQLDQALLVQEQGLKMNPTHKLAWANYALILKESGRQEDSETAINKAIHYSMDDDDELWLQYGSILLALKYFDLALSAYQHAISLNPENYSARLYISFIYIKQGRWLEGWNWFEYRLHIPASTKQTYTSPIWDGRETPRAILLVHSEQGLGDMIQFMRYLPLLKPLFKEVVLHMPKAIAPLFNMIPGVDHWVVSSDTTIPDHDVRISAMSLPAIFETRVDHIPGKVPYLYVPEQSLYKWQSLPEMQANIIRVGLVWAGNRLYYNDLRRSIAFELLQPILLLQNIQFWSLQKEHEPQSRHPDIKLKIIDKMYLSADMADTAALIMNLDLVITVDTVVAHLAGALGKEVWILLPFNSDYRWLDEGNHTPWYPSARLFRQDRPRDWPHVIKNVKSELIDWFNKG
jgi:tetratricopeptide (TPR) repeat protein